jgi:uncharacterized protein (DUF1800 family)
MWRAGFGPSAKDLNLMHTAKPHELYKSLERNSNAFQPIDVADGFIKSLMSMDNVPARQMLSEDERRALRKQNRDDIKKLNLTWLDEMTNSDAQLREKMALFWHGHFACRNMNVIYQQQLLDVIRKNALGNFSDLLREVSKSAAMLNFLNNNQNRKDHPNENFAREVMELFTLGRGNYSEHDVKEGARAFTGWGNNLQGEFIFRPAVHDAGSKDFLGETGDFDGDKVLDILLEKKQTASFITKKIYRYFVNEEVNTAHADWLANRFYKNNYNISGLMKDIFTSEWFYADENIGTHIKSPVELIAGIRRMLPMNFENQEVQLLLERVLGQILFYPPNVAGWPGGKNWIDSSSLMFRLRIPQLIEDQDEITIRPKDDDDQMMGMKDESSGLQNKKGGIKSAGRNNGNQIKADIDWSAFYGAFKDTSKDQLITEMSAVLLQVPTKMNAELLKSYADQQSRENYIRSVTIRLMSTPEYQLC